VFICGSITQVGLKPFFGFLFGDAFSIGVILDLVVVEEADSEVFGVGVIDV